MELKLLSCPLCSTPNFHSVDALRLTLVTVATTSLTCPVCPETLLGLDKLTIHLFSHINGAPINNAKKTFQEEIDKRIDFISNCDSEGTSMKNETKIELIKCDICNFSFTDRNILEMHQKLLHQTSPDKAGSYSYHCHLCSKKFRMRGSLMVHLRVAHLGFGQCSKDVDCSGTKKANAEDSHKGHKQERDACDSECTQKNQNAKQQDNKQWECDICFKMFTTKYFLKKHKRLHTGEMPYCCTLCNKSFTFQQSYHKHMLYHSSEKPHACTDCGRAFKELSTLQNHARIHSGEKPFSCETCGKSFRQRVSYLVHRRIHTGVMPYKCTACDKTFRYKVSQKSHKCPANPPGSVILIPDPEKPVSSLMPVEINSTTPNQNASKTSQSAESSAIQKTSIVLNNNQHIEISYNKADLESAIDQENLSRQHSSGLVNHKSGILDISSQRDMIGLAYTEGEKDMFSMVLSPLLPEVESLCLNNSPLSNSPTSPAQEGITLSTEKLLEDFCTNCI